MRSGAGATRPVRGLGLGAGAQEQLGISSSAADYIYGGTLDTNLQSQVPVALGGRGNLVGSFNNTATIFLGAYFNWQI